MSGELLDANSRAAWNAWLSVARDRCHLHYQIEGGTLESHVETCFASSRQIAERIARDIVDLKPSRILEIGCSVGFNCMALQKKYPEAEVIGIEPDAEAVAVGNAMSRAAFDDRGPRLIRGVGEEMAIESGSVDLIVCHTVIEHVTNVSRVIAEMARVLSEKGVLHLEAPNYVWPREPHIGVWCVPLLGKPSVRLMARLQRKTERISYIDHLQFVHPRLLETLFRKNGLVWENRVRSKMAVAASGNSAEIKLYHGPARLLQFLDRLGMSGLATRLLLTVGLYPSVLYLVHRKAASTG